MNYDLPEFENKDLIFIGKDREWKSFEKFITENSNYSSLKNIYIDDSNRDEHNKTLQNLDFTQYVIVKTAGYPGHLVPAPYTTPTKIFFKCIKQIGAKTIGVTGTKGKTTTATLLAAMLKNAGYNVRLAGNMGSPMLDALEDATSETLFVIELSSYQLAELEVSPDIALITNLYRDHIDYHQSLERYWEAKRNIMRYMEKGNKLIFNPATEIVYHWLAESEAEEIPIDVNEQVDMSQAIIFGDHNKVNYIMAKTAAQALGVEKSICKSTLRNFQPVKHRLEKVRTVRGITFIDDAIATQPEATMAGIEACIRNVGPVGCVFLGGSDNGLDYSGLVKQLSTLMIPKLVLFPDTGAKIKEMLPEKYTPEIFEASNMDEAVSWAAENCPGGSVCLLSTAAKSFSLWKDFEDKGDQFQNYVNLLSN